MAKGTYRFPASAGSGVDVYVIDTGINIAHVDFGGRAIWGATIPAGEDNTDGYGHGTHVTGTAISKTYGLAKKAHAYAVKVLGSNGYGTNGDVIKGVEWAATAAIKGAAKKRRSVANMSLGGGFSQALNDAVTQAIVDGLPFAVAAGNDGEDACGYSPASVKTAISVGASSSDDTFAYFSNTGNCVSIIAPGVDILSTYIGSNNATQIMSGTSMASPHVAGLMALYLGSAPFTPAQLKARLLKDSIAGRITGVASLTTNRLASSAALLSHEKK
jgi:cerevisin